VKLRSSTQRLVAAMLLIFFVGFLMMSARSSSHGEISHHHQAGHTHHDEDPAETLGDIEHTHAHNPLDHSHDIPLHTSIAIRPAPTFFRGWLSSTPLPPHSPFLLPLERPPKSPLAA
jgi:hypothetical protein